MNFFIKVEDTFQVKFIENSWEELLILCYYCFNSCIWWKESDEFFFFAFATFYLRGGK